MSFLEVLVVADGHAGWGFDGFGGSEFRGVSFEFVDAVDEGGPFFGRGTGNRFDLLNAGEEVRSKGSHVATLLGIPGVVIGGVLIAWILLGHSNTPAVSMFALPGDPRAIARLLFHDFLLPFEVTSVLILIAIMGAVVLASRPEAVARGPRKDR